MKLILTLLWLTVLVTSFPFDSLSPRCHQPTSSHHVADNCHLEARPQDSSEPVDPTPDAGRQSGDSYSQPPFYRSSRPGQHQAQDHSKSQPAGPLYTLSPSVHWSTDTKPLQNVEPIAPMEVSKMHYGQSDPSKEGYFASVTYLFTVHSVNLDHTKHVAVKYTKDKRLRIRFRSDESFRRAARSWDANRGLLLITSVAGCPGPNANERCYFRVAALQFDNRTRTSIVTGQPEHPEKLFHHAEAEWGLWKPGNSKGSKDKTNDSTASASTGPHHFNWTSHTNHSKPYAAQRLRTAHQDPSLGAVFDNRHGYHKLSPENELFLNQAVMGGRRAYCGEGNGSAQCQYHSRSRSRSQRRHLRSLQRRGWWSDLWNGFVSGIKYVYNTVADALSIGGQFSTPFDWDLPGPGVARTPSPWSENSILLYEDTVKSESKAWSGHLSISCVDCGVSGHAVLAGKAKLTPLRGIFDATVSVVVDMKMIVKIGIDADVEFSKDLEHDLFTVGLPGLSYGIVTVGPYVAVAARVGFDAKAEGKLLVGAEMGLTKAEAALYVFEPSRSHASGWTPYFQPVLEVEGELAVSVKVALPISVKIGLKIASFEASIGLVDEPALRASASFSGAVAYNNASGEIEAASHELGGCAGIRTSIDWSNKLYLDVLGLAKETIFDTGEQPIIAGCIGGGGGSKTPQTTTTTTALQGSQLSETTNITMNGTSSNDGISNQGSSNVKTAACGIIGDNQRQVFKHGVGFNLTSLVTNTGSDMMVSCDDGNVEVVKTTNTTRKQCRCAWPMAADAVVPFDGSLKVLHYHAEPMDKFGVSQLRASPEHMIPNDTVVVVLEPSVENGEEELCKDREVEGRRGGEGRGSSDWYYEARDSLKQVFSLIVCSLVDSGSSSRVFLVRDLDMALAALGRNDDVTGGGKVGKCSGLFLPPSRAQFCGAKKMSPTTRKREEAFYF